MNKQTMIWIDALLAGTISQEDFAQLQAVLKSDAGARHHYKTQADIHGRLEWELGEHGYPVAMASEPAPLAIPTRWGSRARWAAAAVLVVSLGLLALQITRPDGAGDVVKTPSPPPSSTPSPSPPSSEERPLRVAEVAVARLTITHDARWDDATLVEGAWLVPGAYALRAGTAEVTFDSGARVILQAPAELVLAQCPVLSDPQAGAQIGLNCEWTRIDSDASNAYIALMSTTLTIRNLDEEVKRKLRLRAAEHQTSMEAEAREILARAVTEPEALAPPRNVEELTERLKAIRGIWKDRGSTDDLMKLTRGED